METILESDNQNKKQSSSPELTPLEYFMVNKLYQTNRQLTRGELVESAKAKFGINQVEATYALEEMLIDNYEYVHNTKYNIEKQKLGVKSFLSITNVGINAIYPEIEGVCENGVPLRAIISEVITDGYYADHHYIVDLKGKNPDLTIHSFTSQIGKDGFSIPDTMHPTYWSSNAIAIEIEIDPTKDIDRVYYNYMKNMLCGKNIYFVVFSETHKKCVVEHLAQHAIGRESYNIIVMSDRVGYFFNKKTR